MLTRDICASLAVIECADPSASAEALRTSRFQASLNAYGARPRYQFAE